MVTGEEIKTANDLQQLVASMKVGEELSLEIWRDGQILDITVTTEKLPSQLIDN